MQGNSGSSTSSKMGNNFTALLDLSFLVSIQYFEMLSVPFQFWVVASISTITHNDFILQLQDHLASRMEEKGDGSKAHKLLVKLFPTKIQVQQPQEEMELVDWNRQLEQDAERLKSEANRQQLRMVWDTPLSVTFALFV
jgi:hypothetical protein